MCLLLFTHALKYHVSDTAPTSPHSQKLIVRIYVSELQPFCICETIQVRLILAMNSQGDRAEEPNPDQDTKTKGAKSAAPATKAKAKAKAKAKVADGTQTPKAQAKGKAKSKAAAKTKPNKAKKPSDDHEDEANKKKKPAGKTKAKPGTQKADDEDEKEKEKEDKKKATANKSVKGVQKRLLEATARDEVEQTEDGDADGEVRDRSKQQKFEMMLAKNQLPAHIVEMWSRAQDDEKNPRKFKTKLINSLFNRDEHGKLSMTPHAPFFAAYRETFEKKRFSHKEKALPKGIFIGRYFGNDEAAFVRSLEEGEIEQVEVAGKIWYSVKSLEASHDKYKLETQKLTQTEKKVDANVCKGLVDAFDNLQWGFKRVANPAVGSGSSSDLLAIKDEPHDEMFDKVKAILEDAKGALERLSKDTMKMAPHFLLDQKHTVLVF